LSCANDSTAAVACAVGVISPARAVVQGDSIPKSTGYITKLRWKSKMKITNPGQGSRRISKSCGAQNQRHRLPRTPDGRYDIYFVYSSKPDALFQRDSFTLNGNGVEIQIIKVVSGNYSIRQV